jgi:hypothetical protein
MSTPTKDPKAPIALWRARAWLRGGHWTDAAYGFGGPDVAEAVGTAAQVGAELTGFLDSLERENVEAERAASGCFAARLEVEPHTGGPVASAWLGRAGRAEHCVRRWEAGAAVGNARGVFDACYAYGNCRGDEGHLLGTAQELGAELARVLGGLSHSDAEVMKSNTDRFFIQLTIELPLAD